MADLPTYDDLFDAGEREVLITPTAFNAAIVRTDGSDVNIAMGIAVAMAQEVAIFAQKAFNETHLSTAANEGGEVLDRWIYDRYQLVRQEAQAAVVTLTFTRTDTSEGITIGEGTVVGTASGATAQTFATINDVVFPLGSVGPLSVQAVAQTTGKAGNVAAGKINVIVTQLEDTTIAVTNAAAAAGGSDEETDTAFAARAREFFVNARRGTRQAILTGALDTAGVDQASVIENLDPNTAIPNYRLQLVISDPDGQANAALADNVQDNLLEYRALGVPVQVTAGIPQYVDITIDGLLFEAGANTTTVVDQARKAIVATVNGIAPGTTLRLAQITAALQGVDQLIVPDDAIVAPAGDLVPDEGGVIRTTTDRVSINEGS